MSARIHLTVDELHRALSLRDLTDPDQGAHALQLVLDEIVLSLHTAWRCTVRTVRSSPVVPVRDNYDRLGFDPADVTRGRRYTRYLSPTVMLRSQLSAELPSALEAYLGKRDVDELIVAPGLAFRRDAVDRTHVGEPHQVDLWRLRSAGGASDSEMRDMVALAVDAVLPGASWRTVEQRHPYTLGGRQVDVLHDGEWLELAECGIVHPAVLRGSGLDPDRWSGLALGMGLERALMLRKGIPDIRYLRASEPRTAAQMLDLDPWRPVSTLPPTTRDISVVVPDEEDGETIGDRVREALGGDADVVESVEVVGRTAHADLPAGARARLRTRRGQSNVLIRIVLRPLDRTLTAAEANELRNAIYRAVHAGPVLELI